MVNIAEHYLSPDLNNANRATSPQWSGHTQPRDALIAIDKVRQIPRRARAGTAGYDALAIVVIDCMNDGSPVRLVEASPAPQAGEIYRYAAMLDRLGHVYATSPKRVRERMREREIGRAHV